MSRIIVRPGLLDRVRRTHGIASNAAMARLIGVTEATYDRLRRGESPGGKTIALLCETFGFTPGEVLTIAATKPASTEMTIDNKKTA